MSNPDPSDSPKKPDSNIIIGLIDAFKSLPPLLAYGGLLLIAIIIGWYVLGDLPMWVLLIPILALVAFVLYGFGTIRAEQHQREKELQHELDKQRIEIERLRLEQEHERESKKDDHEHERELAKLTPPPVPQPTPQEPDTPAEWPASYLKQLQEDCGKVNMAAIDPRAKAKGARAELSLQAIFTELDVPRRWEKGEPTEREMQRLREEDKRQPVLKAISEEAQLVLKGAPGAGKSTLVRYLTLCLAGEGLGDSESNSAQLAQQGWTLPSQLPVRVILRDYAARGLPQGHSLWQFIVAELKSDKKNLGTCAPPLQKHLQEKGGLLMLDGLDEVPEAHQRREALRQAIIQFRRDFPRVRLLVTTRPYAYENGEWRLDGFAETELLDFSPEQIEAYIGRWYTAAGTQDPDLPPDRAAQYAQQLQREVKYNPNLGELAERPLLLALMVSLHRSREGGALPHKRVELYDESVNLLLDLWQRPKIIYDDKGREQGEQLSALTELGIDQNSLRRVLSQLAYEVHHDQPELVGTADITYEKLIIALTHAIPKEKRGEINRDKIALYVRDRAGLLEDRGEDVYGFPHRTFQEYLAAMHLLHQKDFPDNLVQLARQDPARWREAVLLAGNSITAPRFLWTTIEALYQKVTPPPAQPSEADFWGGFLAGQLLADSDLLGDEAQMDEAIGAGVRDWQLAIVAHGALPPRDRAGAGVVLGQLGDPRLGVGVNEQGVPDIAWGGVVPVGTYRIGGDSQAWGSFDKQEVPIKEAYQLAKYPITNAQFAAFVNAPDVHDPQWWEGLSEREKQFSKSTWTYGNHPRTDVSWYQAMAFCRWLSDKLGYEVRLPHEHEWEVAARYGHGKAYPWGDEFDQTWANTREGGIGQTTAVGLYPTGRQTKLDLYDMSGNVLEWCQNKYEEPEDTAVDSSHSDRVLRGGSWNLDQEDARVSYRNWNNPFNSGYRRGFRVVAPIVL